MKVLALIWSDESGWEKLSQEERQAWYEQYRAFSRPTRGDKLVDANELAPTTAATTVRVRDGETIVTDGPFAETREQLGGYYLFDCETLDEALDLAARIPAAEHGAVEVRPGTSTSRGGSSR